MPKYNYRTISFIIPTIGRQSLKDTLDSIKPWPGDEILIIQHSDSHIGIYGNAERQEGTDKAKCDYLAYIDDDDVYVAGAREIMDKAIKEGHSDKPILFRMQYPNGRILWLKRWVKNGNVSTQMILVPNKKDMLPEWDIRHRWGDFHFINRWKWPKKDIIWRSEVIALLGHNDEKYENNWTYSEWKRKLASKG
ncbi:MAG TPA: hypothetical protein VI336_00265 [Candidatus Saccharimonadales bacterium]|nr:hypothetical protein [Candidatus Saccharimonadales bacterium]